MFVRFNNLINHCKFFLALTGLRPAVAEFITLLQAQPSRLERPNRKRKVGTSHPFELNLCLATRFY